MSPTTSAISLRPRNQEHAAERTIRPGNPRRAPCPRSSGRVESPRPALGRSSLRFRLPHRDEPFAAGKIPPEPGYGGVVGQLEPQRQIDPGQIVERVLVFDARQAPAMHPPLGRDGGAVRLQQFPAQIVEKRGPLGRCRPGFLRRHLAVKLPIEDVAPPGKSGRVAEIVGQCVELEPARLLARVVAVIAVPIEKGRQRRGNGRCDERQSASGRTD